jgi:hypothetical protein
MVEANGGSLLLIPLNILQEEQELLGKCHAGPQGKFQKAISVVSKKTFQ